MLGFLRSLRPSAGRIAPGEAVARHARGELTVVDVRDISELRAGGTAAGALHVPLMRLAMAADPRHPDHLAGLDPERPVALFCAGGGRSAMGCATLRRMGYAEVYNLGGLGDWRAGGGEVRR